MKKVHLKVPSYTNFNQNSCFVTTIAMVLRYYGKRINQRGIFRKAQMHHPRNKRKSFGCTVPSVMFALKKEGYKMTAWQNKDLKEIKRAGKEMELYFETWEKQIKLAEKQGILKTYKNRNFSLIKKYLNLGTPVILGIKAKTFYKENSYWEKSVYNNKNADEVNHVVVITGYEGENYFYNDSSPFLPKNKRKDQKISASKLTQAWRSANYIKNAIFVLEKI